MGLTRTARMEAGKLSPLPVTDDMTTCCKNEKRSPNKDGAQFVLKLQQPPGKCLDSFLV